jgi:hypothetical protein
MSEAITQIDAAQELALVADRQRAMLEMLSGISTSTENPWRSSLSRWTACFLLGKQTESAAAWFQDAANHRHDDHAALEWCSLQMLRAYHVLYTNSDFARTGTKRRVGEFLIGEYLPRLLAPGLWGGNYLGDKVWAGSENHVIVRLSIRLLAEELSGDAMDRAAWKKAARLIRKWCWEKAVRGMTEFSSPHYTERCLLPLLNVYDLSADAALREYVRLAIDHLFAEYIVTQINGFRGGAMRRFYQYGGKSPCAELSDGRYDCLRAAGWTFFPNITDDPAPFYPICDQKLGHMFYATTTYRPSPTHLRVAAAAAEASSVLRSGRRWEHEYAEPAAPDACLYSFKTPHYMLSSIRIPDGEIWGRKPDASRYHETTNRGIPFRVSFRKPRGMVGPACRLTGSKDADHGFVLDPPDARVLFQWRNIVIYQGAVDTYRMLKPPITDEDSVAGEERDGPYRFFREAGVNGETVYVGAVEENGLGGLEVKLASDFASWGTFKRIFAVRQAGFRSPEDFEYIGCAGERILGRVGRVWINGEETPLEGWPLYESEFLNAKWLNQSDEAGLIVMGNDRTGRLALDFRDLDRPVRTETPPTYAPEA